MYFFLGPIATLLKRFKLRGGICLKTITTRRIGMVLLGNLFIGLAVALFRVSALGTDPFTTMNLGLSDLFNLSFGIFQLIINGFLLIITIAFYRQSIGLGTLVNMVSIGFISDFFVNIFTHYFSDLSLLSLRLTLMIFAVFVISLGVALYITPELGMAPYDALAFVVEKLSHNKIPFAVARISTDITCVVIGFSLGATVGIATVISAAFTGPIVQFFRQKVAEPLLSHELETQATIADESTDENGSLL